MKNIPRRAESLEGKGDIKSYHDGFAPTCKPEFSVKMMVYTKFSGKQPFRVPVIANDVNEAVKRALKLGMTLNTAYRVDIKGVYDSDGHLVKHSFSGN